MADPVSVDSLGVSFVREASGRWRVVVIKAGTSLNGNHYSPEVLQEAAPLFEGRPLMVYDLKDGHMAHLPVKVQSLIQGGIIKAAVGVLSGVHYDQEAQALVAEATITADWLHSFLERAAEASKGPVTAFGLSINAAVERVREAARNVIKAFRWVDSVDVVTTPAAGGAFIGALEALAEENSMDESKVRELIQEAMKGLATPDAIRAMIAEALKGSQTQEAAEAKALEAVEKMKAELAAERHGRMVGRVVEGLTKAYGPSTMAAVVKAVAASTQPGDTEEKVREAAKAIVDELPGPSRGGLVEFGADSGDKMAAGVYQLLGVATEEEAKSAPSFRGIQEAYQKMTGDTDLSQDIAQEATQLSTTFTVAFGEALHRRMRKVYKQMDFGEDKLISSKPRISDFKGHNVVAVGGFGDLAVVAENNAYTEFTLPSEEYEELKVAKRGKLLPLTWESIRNDDLNVSAGHADRLARAARRTLAKAVFNLFKTPPTMKDTYAWISADHSNAGTTALSYAALISTRLAMLAQTEQGSSEPLGIDLKQGGYIIIPAALEATLHEILTAPEKPGAATYGNFVSGWFGSNRERVVVDPFATDANNWYTLADPQMYETIVVGFLDGQETPEVLYANAPTVLNMWTKDVVEYKVRHVWGLIPADYRTVYGHVVA